VIAADHQHWKSAREFDDPGGDPDAVPRNDAAIGEPEIVDIASEQERVAERRHCVQEGKECVLPVGGGRIQVGVGNDDKAMSNHRRERWTMHDREATDGGGITTIRRRVDYSETDQQSVVYHARYLVWLDVARTEHLRVTGMSYRDMEASGYQLMVSDLSIRYRKSARYDDPIRVRTWVRAADSRRVIFGYAVEHDETDVLFATATTALFVLDSSQRLTRFPSDVLARLVPTPDPVRI
jgi:acyl-CoA thioester hydrolase